MKIIALKGKNGSGKSTVATMLSQKLTEKGISNKVLAFADPLKKILNLYHKKMFQIEFEFEERKSKEQHRKMMVEMSKSIKESFSFNPFVQELLNQLDLLYDNNSVVIVSDLRFESEYSGLYNWLETDDLTIVEISNVLTNNNPPEYELDLITSDRIINFDSSLENQLEEIINQIL